MGIFTFVIDMKYECNNYCYERSCKEKGLLALKILTNTVFKCSPSCKAKKLVHLQLFPFQIIREYGSTKSCTYVGLYGSGLFNFGSHLTLFTCFLGFDIPKSSIMLLEIFFVIFVII